MQPDQSPSVPLYPQAQSNLTPPPLPPTLRERNSRTFVLVVAVILVMIISLSTLATATAATIRFAYPSVKAMITGLQSDSIVRVGQPVTFSGTNSTGKSLTYSWSFSDDRFASTTTANSEPSVTKTFQGYEANASATLTVTDPLGASSGSNLNGHSNSTTIKFHVYPTAPVAAFTATVSATQYYYYGIYADFDASATIGTQVRDYTWDFGDGSAPSTTYSSTRHAYKKVGTYTVSLTVTDVVGQKNTTTQSVIVKVPPPTGAFTSRVGTFSFGYATVRFTASDSSNSISTYVWDFGDGKTETRSYSSTYHDYTNAGTYVVKLTVTDTFGQTATTQNTITVA